VPATQQLGDRTDAVVQVDYDSGAAWSAYAFVQDTLSKSATVTTTVASAAAVLPLRRALQARCEVSDGDSGIGGRLGTNYLLSERTNLY